MPTRAAVIARFTSEFYPDCGSTEADAYFDDSLRAVLVATELTNAEVTATVTSGQPNVALSENVIRIHQAFYETSAALPYEVPLAETSIDELSILRQKYRTLAGAPQAYYATSGVSGQVGTLQIGLTPTPNVTSSGGYPRIRFITTMYIQLASGESLPTGLDTMDAILYHMARQYATRRDTPQRMEAYDTLYRRAIATTVSYVRRRMKKLPSVDLLPKGTPRVNNVV